MTTIVISLHWLGAATGNPHENGCLPVSSHVVGQEPDRPALRSKASPKAAGTSRADRPNS